jgi:para-nitrobenzyl esterase
LPHHTVPEGSTVQPRCLPVFAALILGTSAAAADTVSVTGGHIEGTTLDESGIHLYRGIPFAAPPTGELRWAPPAPVETWDGVLRADTWGTHCMQGEMFGGPLVTRGEQMGEDCLYLNIWTPTSDPNAGLPVFVVFHGGGFAAGSASEARTDGAWFARRGMVVVAPNYRLGLFGFLGHPELSRESGGRGSGNYGMLDQVAALEWVRDNIAAFGGDPENVTVNGESAGSMSVSAHMVSPLSKHLIHKAIGQSGAFFESPDSTLVADPLEKKERDGLSFAESVGASSIRELRAMSAETLLAAVMSENGGWGYGPGIDGHFFEQDAAASFEAGEQAKIPLLAGWTSSELGMSIALNPEKPTRASFRNALRNTFGSLWRKATDVYPGTSDEELLQSAADYAGDMFISFATWKWIEVHAATSNAPVYRYRFDRTIPGDPASAYGAIHASDIEYSFNTLDSKPGNWQAADREVAEIMSTAFANFILTGDPNGDGVPEWPEYGATGRVMYFDTTSAAGPEEGRARYELLDEIMRDRR